MNADEITLEDDRLIMNDVARAVEEHEFVPYVQPTFDLASGSVIGAEALVRWTLPEDGTVVPASLFVPSLERMHMITGLDWFMIDETCTFLADSRGTSANVPIAINLSPQHADDASFATRLVASADWHEDAHGLLLVELSEKTIVEGGASVARLISTTAEAGFTVVADNFASDVAWLRRLAEMGVGEIKVSATLWRDASPQELSELVETASELGVLVCAEGVEEQQEKDKLLSAGFERAQGYFLAHPMSLDEFVKLCEA